MSTIENRRAAPAKEADPFRYGWRYVTRRTPDGRVEREQVPLKLEDLLHPEEGDFLVQTAGHIQDWTYLHSVFQARLSGEPTALVLSDCRVDWDLPGVRPLGPDVAVFLGVREHRDWGTFALAEERARPILVVEVTSPETRVNDFGIKKRYYHRAGVPLYVIVDARPIRGARRLRVLGFRHTPAAYEPFPNNERGRIPVESLGIEIGTSADESRVACYDSVTGREIGDYSRVCEELEAAEARVAAEARARADAEAQVAAEARARADAEAQVAAEVRARADAEAQVAAEARARADAEARADAAEARLQELEAEVRRLRGGA